MLTEKHLDVVRRVLEGKITYGMLVSKEPCQERIDGNHRAAVAVALMLIVRNRFHGQSRYVLHPTGLSGAFEELLAIGFSEAAVAASRRLKLHDGDQSGVLLTPPASLEVLIGNFSKQSPGVVAFLSDIKLARAAKDLKRREAQRGPTLPDHCQVAPKASALLEGHMDQLRNPVFAALVLARLFGDKPALLAEAIGELCEEDQATIVTALSNVAVMGIVP